MPGLKMVDITGKTYSHREAEAEGRILLKGETIRRIREGSVEKGDVIEVAKVAAIQSVKRTPEILPLCHPIKITSVDVSQRIEDRFVEFLVRVKAQEQTGVEMEALTGLSAALLTVWDMVKMYEKDESGNYPDTRIQDIRVRYKVKTPVG